MALSSWAKGGDNAISRSLSGTLGLKYIGNEWGLRNNLTLAYGRIKLGSGDFRTNDNDFYLETVLSRKLNWAVDPYISNTIRTPITTGYNYPVNPIIPSADFFDPGYLTQSIGLIYNKTVDFTTRIGIAVQGVFTKKYSALYNIYPASSNYVRKAGRYRIWHPFCKLVILIVSNIVCFTNSKGCHKWKIINWTLVVKTFMWG
ncbi:MAG: DUF3078 domain-containing protein [Ignavibacteriaceae bacterium]|nr:DUF3078 domain-containing protein [Ignavibacteriaceae bacterium]